MRIESNEATIDIKGGQFGVWAHVRSICYGEACTIHAPSYPGDQVYLATDKSKNLYIILVKDAKWLPEVEAAGYIILKNLAELLP